MKDVKSPIKMTASIILSRLWFKMFDTSFWNSTSFMKQTLNPNIKISHMFWHLLWKQFYQNFIERNSLNFFKVIESDNFYSTNPTSFSDAFSDSITTVESFWNQLQKMKGKAIKIICHFRNKKNIQTGTAAVEKKPFFVFNSVSPN